MVLINLDDSVLWRSHSEIPLKNSWTSEKLKKELKWIRKTGIELISMLNFASIHDAWMENKQKWCQPHNITKNAETKSLTQWTFLIILSLFISERMRRITVIKNILIIWLSNKISFGGVIFIFSFQAIK